MGGGLRVFLNVCRHRGSLVCEGEGTRASLQCAETLGELPALVDASGVDLGSLRFLKRASGDEYAANWKVCSENFLECYHCQVAHPDFSKVVDVSVDAYVLEESRTFSCRRGPRRPRVSSITSSAPTSSRNGSTRCSSSTTVGAEDRVLVERVRRGVRGGGVEHGRLMGDSERLIAHFQALLLDALA